MDSWKSLLIVFALVGLFSMAFLNGIGILQITNGVNNSIFTSPVLNQFNTSVYSNLNKLNSSSNTFNTQINNESSQDVTYQGALTLGTIFHSLTTFSGFLYDFSGAFLIMINSLGIGSIILSVIGAILIIVVILLFWRLYKLGQ